VKQVKARQAQHKSLFNLLFKVLTKFVNCTLTHKHTTL